MKKQKQKTRGTNAKYNQNMQKKWISYVTVIHLGCHSATAGSPTSMTRYTMNWGSRQQLFQLGPTRTVWPKTECPALSVSIDTT